MLYLLPLKTRILFELAYDEVLQIPFHGLYQKMGHWESGLAMRMGLAAWPYGPEVQVVSHLLELTVVAAELIDYDDESGENPMIVEAVQMARLCFLAQGHRYVQH